MITASQPILVATDLSARADRAIDRAVMLGQQVSRAVIALHVVPPEKVSVAEAERRLHRVLPNGGAGIQSLVSEGSVPEEIAAIADEQDAAIICTGVARFNSIGDFLLGTAVDALVRQASRPVLVVKERPQAPYETVIFATDFSACSREALLHALALFPQASFHVIHAFHVPYAAWNKDAYVKEDIERQAQAELDEFLATIVAETDAAARIQGSLVEGNLLEGIGKLAEETGASLAAFGTHGEGGFRQATIGSMANELLKHLPLDSLVIRPID